MLCKDGKIHHWKERLLKPFLVRGGYYQVRLQNNKKKQMYLVHRLVAEAFIPNPNSLPEVNHKSECKTENTVENLEWVDRKTNINYGSRNERCRTKEKNRVDLSKPVIQISVSGDYINVYPSAREAYRKTGVHYMNISKCLTGKRKSAGGYIWKYKEV